MEKATRFPPNELLKAHRKRRCWTQEQLAEEIGTTPKNVGRWERGETSPGPYYCQRLCEVFRKSPWELGLIQEDAMLRTLAAPMPESARDTMSQTASINEEASERDGPQSDSSRPYSSADGSTRSKPHFPETFPAKLAPRWIAVAVLCLVVVIAGFIGFSKYFATPAHAHIRPGGSWISPISGQTVSGVIHFAAFAYPTNPADPAIDHVNFTAWWQGVDPRTWIIACTVHAPSTKDVFRCDVNLAQLSAPAGQIIISFDVYDQNGDSNLAPNGEHMIMYSP